MKITLLILSLFLAQQAEEIKFNQLIEEGIILPTEKYEQYGYTDRPTYTLFDTDTTVIEYAYKGEIKEWIRTGEFEYNDFLKD
jgi:hypothetical protein